MNTYNRLSKENMKTRFQSRNLPHLFDRYKPVFITYRLKFSLPHQLMVDYQKQIKDWYAELEDLSEDERKQKLKNKDKRFFDWYDQLLGLSSDIPYILHKDGIREIIQESFHHFDGVRYTLLGYCIMPNHVHVLISPMVQEDGNIFSTSHIVYTWKRYTANAINKVLGKRGNLWQKECYDSLVKDKAGLGRVLEYIVNNPVKANLVKDWRDWKGTYMRDGIM